MRILIDGTTYPLSTENGGVFGVVDVQDQMTDGIPGKGYNVRCYLYQGPQGTTTSFILNAGAPNNPVGNTEERGSGEPQLHAFDLDNIDEMRQDILAAVASPVAFEINGNSIEPYGLGLDTVGGIASGDYENAFCRSSQEGLGIKTYQSDLFNNWISTEWIDGPNGVAAVTAVDTTGNEFTIDALNLANKVYNMLNRIAISGGSYDDWLDAVYTHERARRSRSHGKQKLASKLGS